MVKGQFTELQNKHIESFFPDFVQQMDKAVAGTKLTRWKQTQASNILDSPLFLTLDLEKFPRKNWFEVQPSVPTIRDDADYDFHR